MTNPMSDQMLARYAELLLTIGVNLQPGQSLTISAELGHAPLVLSLHSGIHLNDAATDTAPAR